MNEWIEVIDHTMDLKPGMLIRMEDGKEYLVGDVNTDLGTCGCCAIYKKITHYKYLIERS